MTAGFTFAASCPRCGGELLAGEAGRVLAPDHTSTEARCDRCMDLWRIEVVATVVEPWPVDLVDPVAREARARDGAAAGAFVADLS